MCDSMVFMERSILDLNASSVPNLFLVQRRWYTLVDHCCLGLPTLRFTIVRGIAEPYLNVVSLSLDLDLNIARYVSAKILVSHARIH